MHGDHRDLHVLTHSFPTRRSSGLLGVEPSLRWRTFCQIVIQLARDLDVELVVTLGSLLADVPHTRASPVTGAASDPALVESLGLQHSRYEEIGRAHV